MQNGISPLTVKFIIYKERVMPLFMDTRGFWVSTSGGKFAFRDKSNSVDDKSQCGVGIFTLPDWGVFREINEAGAVHDYMYESPVYQAFHTRKEADEYLGKLLELKGHTVIGKVFSNVAKLLGWLFWENPKTR